MPVADSTPSIAAGCSSRLKPVAILGQNEYLRGHFRRALATRERRENLRVLKWMLHQKVAPLHYVIDPLSQIGWDPISLQQIEKPSSSAFLIGHEEISKFSFASSF